MTKNALALLVLSLGLVAINIVANIGGVRSSIDLNLTYIRLVRALDVGTPAALERVAEQFSSAVAAQPMARRRWDEALVWFRLGQYERAAHVLAAIDPQDLVMPLRGTQPSLGWRPPPGEKDTPEWRAIVSSRPPAEYLILKGILQEEDGRWAEALQLYRLALVVAPQIYDDFFYRHYYNALAHSQDPVDRSVASSILRLLPPASDISSGALVLTSGILTDTLRCGRVVSFDYDEDALERGPLVPMRLGWECSSEGRAASGCLQSGQSIVQWILAVNLIPNAGFEWGDVSGRVYPLGHERTIHREKLAHGFLTDDERSGRTTHVAGLISPGGDRVSLVPAPIAVMPDALYLQVAWAKSPGGIVRIAVWWRGSHIGCIPSSDWWGMRPIEWKALYRVVKAPSDAYYVDAIIECESVTEPDCYFDDVLFVPLPESPCVQEMP